MRYLFLGSYCEQAEESLLLSWSKVGIQSSIIVFQRNMLQGLRDCLAMTDSIEVINFYPLGVWPRQCSKFFLKKETKQNYHRLALINIPLIKQLSYNLQARMQIKKWLIRHQDENVCLITYDMLRPYLKVMSEIPSNPRIWRTTIIADLLNEFGYNKYEHGVKGIIKSKIGYDSMRRVRRLDFCGLLTKQMAYPLKLGQKRSAVIEGFSNGMRYFKPLENTDHIVLFYGGVLSQEYQIDVLIDAFSEIKSSNMELWLCGSGQYVPTIMDRANETPRLKYFGHMTQEEVAMLQAQATILINPRQNLGEYTKYSFPSKIIEYLSTARPVIAYRLDGISDGYFDYIFTPGDNSVLALRNTIIDVAQTPCHELRERGLAGREFVISRTSPKTQMSKLLNGMLAIKSEYDY